MLFVCAWAVCTQLWQSMWMETVLHLISPSHLLRPSRDWSFSTPHVAAVTFALFCMEPTTRAHIVSRLRLLASWWNAARDAGSAADLAGVIRELQVSLVTYQELTAVGANRIFSCSNLGEGFPKSLYESVGKLRERWGSWYRNSDNIQRICEEIRAKYSDVVDGAYA